MLRCGFVLTVRSCLLITEGIKQVSFCFLEFLLFSHIFNNFSCDADDILIINIIDVIIKVLLFNRILLIGDD